jgi:hypothetical protein
MNAAGMSADQRLHLPLLVVTGAFIACLFLMLAPLRFPGLTVTAFIASLPLFVLLLAFLIGTVWRGVAVHGMTKMDAWWWLSAPYSVGFPLCVLVFRLQEFGHPLAAFFFLCAITTLSLAAWTLTAVYQITISKARKVGRREIAMLAIAVLTGIVWTVLIANPGQ